MTSASGRKSCICPREEILHLSPEGDPTSPTKRTPFFGPRKDTLLRLPDGYSSSSPERSSCLDPGRKPFLCHRKDTLHSPPPGRRPYIYPRTVTLYLPPRGDPTSALKRRPRIDAREAPSIFHRTEIPHMHPKGQHCISHGKETSHRPPGENHTSAPKKTPC